MKVGHAIALVLLLGCAKREAAPAVDASATEPQVSVAAPEPSAPPAMPSSVQKLLAAPSSSVDPRVRACAALEICLTPAAAKKLGAPDAGASEGCVASLDAKKAKGTTKKRLVLGADGTVPFSDVCSARARESHRAETCCYNVPSGLDATLRDLDN